MCDLDRTGQEVRSALVHQRVASGVAPASILASQPAAGESSAVAAGNAGDSSAPDIDTVFRIASCTKSFTAARVMQLRDRGRIDLDRAISTYLPSRPRFFFSAREHEAPSARMLLTMSAGLATDDAWADRLESMPQDDFDALLARGVRLCRVPGTAYEYSNLGWAILGRAIEYIDGRDLQEQITKELLGPLGLQSIQFSVPDHGRVAVGHAMRDTGWVSQPVSGPGAFSAIGGLFASSRDLLSWAEWLASAFDDGKPQDLVLAASSRREMQQLHQFQTMTPDGIVRGYGYGLVVEHSERFGHVVAHSGGYPGFSAHMRWSIDRAVTMCGFENAGYAGVHTIVTQAFEERLSRHAPKRVLEPSAARTWPETQAAAESVRDLLEHVEDASHWETTGREHFDTCVDLDLPLPDRQRHLAGIVAGIGAPMVQEDATFPCPARARWRVRGPSGAFEIALQMTPLDQPKIQRFDVFPQ